MDPEDRREDADRWGCTILVLVLMLLVGLAALMVLGR
jgi:hypothetical protein